MSYERDADELAMASRLQEQLNDDARAAVARKILAAQEQPADFDGCCVVCGDDLPPTRLESKWIRCTGCQTTKEKQDKMRGVR